MNQREKAKIKDNYVKLAENIDPVHIMTYLPCIGKHHRESITNAQLAVQGGRLLAAQKLMDILLTRPTGFKELVDALRNPEVDMHNIADCLDPPDASLVEGSSEKSEHSVAPQRNTTIRVLRKSQKKQVTMETHFKDLPYAVHNKLRAMDAGQFKNADKLAEVIGLTWKEVEDIKARKPESLTIACLRCWDEKEEITLQDLFEALQKVERIDLIEELENTLHVKLEPDPDSIEEENVREEQLRNNTATAPRLIPKVSSDASLHNGHANESRGGNQADKNQFSPHAINSAAAHPDVSQQRPIGSERAGDTVHSPNFGGHLRFPGPRIPAYSDTQWAPVHGSNMGSLNRQISQSPHNGREEVTPVSGPYSDKSQEGIGSLQSDWRGNPKSERKFDGYSPEVLLGNNQSDVGRYVVNENGGSLNNERSLKDESGKFKGYKREEILGDVSDSNGMRATNTRQTVMNIPFTSPKPFELGYSKENHQSDVPPNPRPEFGVDIVVTSQNSTNDLDNIASSSSSNTDNSLYGSMSDNNQDFDSIGDKKVENVGHVCDGAQFGGKFELKSSEKGNIEQNVSCNVIPSKEFTSMRFASVNSAGLSGDGRVDSTNIRLFEHNLLVNGVDDVMHFADPASRVIAVADDMSDYSYVSAIIDIDRPKLSIQSELASIERKRNKVIPGMPTPNYSESNDCNESNPCSLFNDLNEEQLSIDGASPGIADVQTHAMSGEAGMFLQSSSGAQGTRPCQNDEPYIIQHPPNFSSLDVHCAENLHEEKFDIPNVDNYGNQGQTHLELNEASGNERNNNNEPNQPEMLQYGQYSVHEPPRLSECGAFSQNDAQEDDACNDIANEGNVHSTSMPIEGELEDLSGAADNGRWSGLASSFRLLFNVFKTAHESLQ